MGTVGDTCAEVSLVSFMPLFSVVCRALTCPAFSLWTGPSTTACASRGRSVLLTSMRLLLLQRFKTVCVVPKLLAMCVWRGSVEVRLLCEKCLQLLLNGSVLLFTCAIVFFTFFRRSLTLLKMQRRQPTPSACLIVWSV